MWSEASTDAAFRAQLESNPEAALAGYGLTADEKAALLRGDERELSELGVDGRVTKQAGAARWTMAAKGPWQEHAVYQLTLLVTRDPSAPTRSSPGACRVF